MRGVFFALALRFVAPPDPAQPEGDPEAVVAEAEAEARAAFDAKDFDRMVELSRDAYARTGDLRFLYAQAHAERLRGDCDTALGLYGRVLAANPTGTYADYAQKGVRLCEEELTKAPPKPEPPPKPAAVEEPGADDTDPVPQPPQPPTAPDTPGRRTDVTMAVLLSAGAIATVTGGTLLVSSDVSRRRANAAEDEATHIENLQRTRTFRISAAVVGSVGVALLGGALARVLVIRRGESQVVLLPDGLGARLSGRF